MEHKDESQSVHCRNATESGKKYWNLRYVGIRQRTSRIIHIEYLGIPCDISGTKYHRLACAHTSNVSFAILC